MKAWGHPLSPHLRLPEHFLTIWRPSAKPAEPPVAAVANTYWPLNVEIRRERRDSAKSPVAGVTVWSTVQHRWVASQIIGLGPVAVQYAGAMGYASPPSTSDGMAGLAHQARCQTDGQRARRKIEVSAWRDIGGAGCVPRHPTGRLQAEPSALARRDDAIASFCCRGDFRPDR